MNNNFTIVIPYHAHSGTIHFAKKQLNYYHFNTTPMAVILAVSGDDKVKAELEQFVTTLNDSRFVMFTTDENDNKNMSSFLKKIYDALKLVTTPYAVINGIDDVVIPEEVCKGIDILANNLDIAAVKGHTILFHCDTGKFTRLIGLDILDDCPLKRIKIVIKKYIDSTFYSIRRTQDLMTEYNNMVILSKKSKAFHNSSDHIEDFAELSVASLGKIYVFKRSWQLRCAHEIDKLTDTGFIGLENGAVDRDTYEFFQSANKNMLMLSYNMYKYLRFCRVIRVFSIPLLQIGYRYIYKDFRLKIFCRLSLYFILNKIFILPRKYIFNKPIMSGTAEDAEDFIETEQYLSLKKHYFSEKDIQLIESNNIIS